MKVPMGPPPLPPQNPKSNPNPPPEHSPVDQIGTEDARIGAHDEGRGGETAPSPAAEPIEDAPAETSTETVPSPEDRGDETAPSPAAEPIEDAPAETSTETVPSPIPNSTPSAPQHEKLVVPYTIPPWSEPPGHTFSLEVLKDGIIIEQLDVSKKGAYMFGRIDLCDFVLEHPTISRFHAVLQFRKDGEALLYDLGSTHGTSINKKQVKGKVYTELRVGDVIRFGHSSRLYIFQGPSELMPPEGDLNKIRSAKIHEEMLDRKASLSRARAEASFTDGISWGMAEDAVEEDTENDTDEVTWQTFKGQLTERQEKTRGKIIKRMEKLANMKKEIDSIRVKDIAQGGLTQGQQTQIARNEQRISQIMEELESLEETLNESIQESMGARSRKVVYGKKKGNVEDEDVILSDDDDFYDRTKKRSDKKSGAQQSVETADTLLDKKEVIISEMEEMNKLLMKEKDKLVHNNESSMERGDDLDAYMTSLSSQLVIDKTKQIQKELSNLQTELDKIMYLLKIADPMGEAARKREEKAQASNSNQPVPDISKQSQTKQKKIAGPKKPVMSSAPEQIPDSTQVENRSEEVEEECENKEKKTPAYTITKPQWLGDTKGMMSEESHPPLEAPLDENESDSFVDYKDRKEALSLVDHEQEIEHAAPGLIIRKRKSVEMPGGTADKAPKVATSSSSEAGTTAADAVALLLKHKRGYYGLDDEERDENQKSLNGDQSGKDNSKSKRVFGPSRPDFLDSRDYESWVPPEGQTGDGRTSLNDRLGY